MLYKVVPTFQTVDEILFEMEAIEQNFPVVLFTVCRKKWFEFLYVLFLSR